MEDEQGVLMPGRDMIRREMVTILWMDGKKRTLELELHGNVAKGIHVKDGVLYAYTWDTKQPGTGHVAVLNAPIANIREWFYGSADS